MSNDTVVKLIQPGILTDRLTQVLRDGARALLTQAVEAEVSEFLAATADLKTDDGCRRVVRHGHLPERQIMTGIGPVAVRQPRVRDREAGADVPARIRFTPTILPPYARRSKSLDTLIPILYLKGVSTGDFAAALAALLGKDALGLSNTTIARLKDVWIDEHKQWSERDLSAKSYVYIWADGVYLQARLEDEAHTDMMQLHLDEISSNVAKGAHAVVLLDRAGWHITSKLDMPENITPIFLPSRAPELNPVENVWQYLRQNWISNTVFENYDAIVDAACDAWRKLTARPETITSIGMRDWAHVGQSL